MLQNVSLLLLIVGFEFLTGARRLGRGYYSNRLLQSEGENALGGELDVGLFARCLHAGTSASSGSCADCGAFASTENSAEDGTRCGSNTNLRSSVFASRACLLFKVIGFDVVPLISNFNSVELQFEQGFACELARRLSCDYVSFDIVVSGNGNLAINGNGRIKCCVESVAGLRGGAVDSIN
jgi:hypothetical protein